MKRTIITLLAAVIGMAGLLGLAGPAHAGVGSDGGLLVSAPNYSGLSESSSCHNVPINYYISPTMAGYNWDLTIEVNKPGAWGDSIFAYGDTTGWFNDYAFLCGALDGPGTYSVVATLTSTDWNYNTGPSSQVSTTLLTCAGTCPVQKAATGVSLTATPTRVLSTRPVTFSGQAALKPVNSATWQPLVKGAVSLQYRKYTTSAWTTVRTTATNSSGRFAVAYVPTASGYFQVARAANSAQAGSVSPSRYVSVAKAQTATSLTISSPPGVSYLALTGQVAVRNPGVTAWSPLVKGSVTIQFRPTTTSTWTTVKTTLTDAGGHFKTAYVPTKSGYYRAVRYENTAQGGSVSPTRFAWRR